MEKEVLSVIVKKSSAPRFLCCVDSSYELNFNGRIWYYSSVRQCVCRLVSLLVHNYLSYE